MLRKRLKRVAKLDRLFNIESYLLRAKLGNMIHWKGAGNGT